MLAAPLLARYAIAFPKPLKNGSDHMAGSWDNVQNLLGELAARRVVLAFSGGVDSSVLLCLAARLGPVRPVLIQTPLLPPDDPVIAEAVAAACGTKLEIIHANPLVCPDVAQNTRQRCYVCKKHIFSALLDFAAGAPVADGTNADDLHRYRPGLRALQELGIVSPLAQCGITKAQILEKAAELGLSVANRPASPCMATRLPYGTPLDPELLARLAKGESLVRSLGFSQVRLRLHGNVLRLEIAPGQLNRVLELRTALTGELKTLGFSYITLDLEGFRSGSMDEV